VYSNLNGGAVVKKVRWENLVRIQEAMGLMGPLRFRSTVPRRQDLVPGNLPGVNSIGGVCIILQTALSILRLTAGIER
jgi:hypothetical protein